MSRLILPGEPSRRNGLQLHVPRGYETGDVVLVGVCRVPTGPETVCGARFHKGEEDAWQRHVGECARQHEAEIHERSPRQRLPIFDEESWDPEIAAHLKKVGERMIREGRLEVRPSEKAGSLR